MIIPLHLYSDLPIW